MNQSRPFVLIAVDGGAASGKSSTSRAVAEQFNLLHIDTGSHYRAVTDALLRASVPLDQPEAVAHFLAQVALDTLIHGRSTRICLCGTSPAPEDLRRAAVNDAVSLVASQPAVRQFLFAYQRSQATLAREKNFAGMIMEGRDIGSVIFPDADLRIFLEADPDTRAARRAAEGETDAIAKRDALDSARKAAPLKCPEGAVRIDSSLLSLEQVVARVGELIHALPAA